MSSTRWRRTSVVALLGAVALAMLLVILDQWLLPLPEQLLQRSSGCFVYSREGRLMTAFTSDDRFWRRPVGLDEISPKAVTSVLQIEDRFFFRHPGVNPVSLVASAIDNLRAGRIVRGGSTITMQIARMIEPKERTIANKVLEIFRAFQLEVRYSKTELLETYFNLVPYGGNIEGIGAAAYFYFDKEPSDLTWSEAALLTAIPGSPEKFRPDQHIERGRRRAAAILKRLLSAGVIDESEYDAALAEEIVARRTQVPRLAPHLAVWLRAKHPDSARLNSTLRYNLQVACERVADEYHRRYVAKDINNLAVVVIDNEKAEVIAQVGNPDFDDDLNGGQVDASRAARSPGSALKPFVYGLAFDRGVLSPQMRVPDIPVNYSGYRPVNYDESYRGVISVREALVHSLNIPAINAASSVGLREVHRALRRGGLTTLEQPFHQYGLPLVLGACEVKLTELTNLYAALARLGAYRPATSLVGSENKHGVQLLSPAASYLLTDILVDLHRPNLAEVWRSVASTFPVAWKTGTSYGRRDAWAVGFTPEYTVGVWVGNCSGEGSVDLVGSTAAAPIMFEVFSEVVTTDDSPWFDRPTDVKERSVCVVSGQPAGRFCEETVSELFIVGKSSGAVCTVHRPIFVDRTTGLRLRARCLDGRDYERRVVEIWPTRTASWMVDNGLTAVLPPYDESCVTAVAGDAPCIVSPEDGAVFEIIDDVPSEYQKIRLRASVPSGDGTVHWFLNGKHLAAVQAGKDTYLVPKRGRHKLLCMDATGRSTTAVFEVM